MSWLAVIELITVLLMTLSQFFSNRPPAPVVAEPLAQRVDSRPEFANKPYLTVIYNFPFDSSDRALYKFIKNDPDMQKVVKQVNLNQYNIKFALYREVWAKFLDENEKPIIILQSPADASGRAKVVYFRSGDKVLVNEQLPKTLQEAIDQMGLNVESNVPGVEVERGILKRVLRKP